jgi:HK97 family phage prohead protease
MAVPPQGVRAEAARGLEWRREYGRGGTAVGVARARDLANGRDISADTIGRMVSYFARHEIDKEGQGWAPGQPGYPSAGRIAWALWGGDPGRTWANSQHKERMTVDERDAMTPGYPVDGATDDSSTDDATDTETVAEPWRYAPRQLAQAAEVAELVSEYGPYDQSSGPNGAHYMADNPFAGEGLACASCIAYEGPRACEWVAGDIDPAGLCKLWVIPADLLTVATPRARQLDVEARKVNGRDREVRVIGTGITVEERAADAPDDTPLRFYGYAAVFNSDSERLYDPRKGDFTETIRPGAFKRTLARDNDVRMYVNHNSDMVLASTRSGTLTLSEDDHGLRVQAELPDTTYARDLANLMRTGVVDSMSFGFSVVDDHWNGDHRELREVALHEVSVVSGHPAYPDTAGATVRTTDDDTATDSTAAPLALMQRYADLYSRNRG